MPTPRRRPAVRRPVVKNRTAVSLSSATTAVSEALDDAAINPPRPSAALARELKRREARKAKLLASLTQADTDVITDMRTSVSNALQFNKVFTTDADPDRLWVAFLGSMPTQKLADSYRCNCCRDFIRKYAGLVTVGETGVLESVLPHYTSVPKPFRPSFLALSNYVKSRAVTGVFLTNDLLLGTPTTGPWSHFHAQINVDAKSYHSKTPLKNAFQRQAELRTDFETLSRSLLDFNITTCKRAMAIIDSDTLYRSEKVEGVMRWFLNLKARVQSFNTKITRRRRDAIIWEAVASAPVGWCHVRSAVIGTLLEDLQSGATVKQATENFAKKMHPLQYCRPTAPPKLGNIERAEKIIETMGLERSLLRRAATLEDLQEVIWWPGYDGAYRQQSRVERSIESGTGLFDDLKRDVARATSVPPYSSGRDTTAARTLTWRKFSETVLDKAIRIEMLVPSHGSYIGFVTARDYSAPPVLQWDPAPHGQRNPLNWYYYHGGSYASRFHLTAHTWTEVVAISDLPCHWHGVRATYPHTAAFILRGCYDTMNTGAALFPETLKSELNEIRDTLEAHSRRNNVKNIPSAGGYAAGYAIAARDSIGEKISLRVLTNDGLWQRIDIDRWD